VTAVGDDARLRAGEGDRLEAEVVDHHRRERAGNALAGGEQHVHLARMRPLGDLVGEGHELVGVLAASGQDGDHVVALPGALHDALGGARDAFGVGHRGAPELHDDRLRHDAED
jgi:hypothetical protein